MTERFSDDEEMLRILVEQQQKDYELNKDLLLERMSDEDLAALQKDNELDEETRLALAQGLGDEADYQNVVPLKTREERDNPLRPFVKTGLEVLSLPKPKALVGDWLDVETVNAWYGKPKGGKTFAALDLGMCVASGTHWHGSPVSTGTFCPVLPADDHPFSCEWKAHNACNFAVFKSPLSKMNIQLLNGLYMPAVIVTESL